MPARAARSASPSPSRTTVAPASAAARSSSLGLRVAVHDELLAGEPCRAREGELAERRHVRADALLGEESKDGHVRERLRPVEDLRFGHRTTNLPRSRTNRFLAVRHERRSEAFRELGRSHSSERQLSVLDPRRVREQLQHRASLPATVFSS